MPEKNKPLARKIKTEKKKKSSDIEPKFPLDEKLYERLYCGYMICIWRTVTMQWSTKNV